MQSVYPDAPPELEKPIAMALRKDPLKRPNAKGFARAFDRAVEESTRTAPVRTEAKLPETIPKWANEELEAETQRSESGILSRWLNKLKKPVG